MRNLVIIPTYDEAFNIKKVIENVLSADASLDILVVDDNSPDGTATIVREFSKQEQRVKLIVREKKLGLGSAYVAGFKYALANGYSLVFEMDADFSHNPEVLPLLIKKAAERDWVIGSRYYNGISVVNWPLRRLALSLMASLYVRAILGMPIKDSTSGFKCFNRRVLEGLDLDGVHSDGYSFQIEMNFRAYMAGFTPGEIPIIFIDRRSGQSKMNRKIVFEALFVVWRLKLEYLFKRRKAIK